MLSTFLAWSQSIPVRLQKTENGFQLLRNGQVYYIQGAGGQSHYQLLRESGGNSLRTWSADQAQSVLDSAHAQGQSVMLGLWLQHERHGFDYDDSAAVAAQKEKMRQTVLRFKDHPALLLWGIGNEVDLFYTNTRVWYAVEDIAAMIKKLDPHHPTLTSTAGFDPEKAALIKERAPSIDILGINTYGEIDQIPARVRASAWPGPYLITEWGPDGHWEVAKSPWGAPLEPSSQQKVEQYRSRYQAIRSDSSRCLGSYVFFWGHKQEVSPTWYGLFTEAGSPTAALHSLRQNWLGQTPIQNFVSVEGLRINGKNYPDSLANDQSYHAELVLKGQRHPESQIEWLLLRESEAESIGGDPESRPESFPRALRPSADAKVEINTRGLSGAYRLFVFVQPPGGLVSYDNLPFWVSNPSQR